MDKKVVYILTATEAQLRTLTYIGEARAKAIIEARKREVLDLSRLAAITGVTMAQWQEWQEEGTISLEMVPAPTDGATAETTVGTPHRHTSTPSKEKTAPAEDNGNQKEEAAATDIRSVTPISRHKDWRESPVTKQFHSDEKESSPESSEVSLGSGISHQLHQTGQAPIAPPKYIPGEEDKGQLSAQASNGDRPSGEHRVGKEDHSGSSTGTDLNGTSPPPSHKKPQRESDNSDQEDSEDTKDSDESVDDASTKGRRIP